MFVQVDLLDPADVAIMRTLLEALDNAEGTDIPEQAEKPSETPLEAAEDPATLDEALLSKAVKKATALLKKGETGKAKVMEALEATGASKVSLLATDEQVEQFLAGLK